MILLSFLYSHFYSSVHLMITEIFKEIVRLHLQKQSPGGVL